MGTKNIWNFKLRQFKTKASEQDTVEDALMLLLVYLYFSEVARGPTKMTRLKINDSHHMWSGLF